MKRMKLKSTAVVRKFSKGYAACVEELPAAGRKNHSGLRGGNLIRPLVRELHPYVYGEQPKIKGLIKLNTNENPYPPSPKVLAAVKAAVDGRLRLYPNPTAQTLREKLAKLHRLPRGQHHRRQRLG
jgi:hypothetical protein